jgi:hypothetical protein
VHHKKVDYKIKSYFLKRREDIESFKPKKAAVVAVAQWYNDETNKQKLKDPWLAPYPGQHLKKVSEVLCTYVCRCVLCVCM